MRVAYQLNDWPEDSPNFRESWLLQQQLAKTFSKNYTYVNDIYFNFAAQYMFKEEYYYGINEYLFPLFNHISKK